MTFAKLGFFLLVQTRVLIRCTFDVIYSLNVKVSYLSLWTEELVRTRYLEDANKVFLKGAKGGLRATDEVYDLLIVEDCKVGDHSNALEIAYEMEAAGRMATTFHFNCLLSVQVFLLIFI